MLLLRGVPDSIVICKGCSNIIENNAVSPAWNKTVVIKSVCDDCLELDKSLRFITFDYDDSVEGSGKRVDYLDNDLSYAKSTYGSGDLEKYGCLHCEVGGVITWKE